MPTLSENNNTNSAISGSHGTEMMTATQDPEFKPSEFVRLILREMSLVYRELQLTREHPSLELRIKSLLAEIQALRSMAETARTIPSMIAESDIVNLDGPKFSYVIGKLTELFQASVREVFGDDLRTANVTRTMLQKIQEIEEDFRRDLDDPHVLMEYQEQARRKREERRSNQTMYSPRYPAS